MEKSRSSISNIYKWDLSKIYADISEYKKDIDKVNKLMDEIILFQDKLLDETSLYQLIDLTMQTERIIDKLETYVSLLCDEDTSINKNQEYKEEISNLCSKYIEKTYFINNNILKFNYSDIEQFYLKNDKLKEYEIMLKNMFREKEHILSDNEEKLLANMSRALGNNYDTYELFKDSDLLFPSFIVDNKEYKLNNSLYGLYIENSNRIIRKTAFENLYGVYKQYKNTFANLISSFIKEKTAIAKVKKYDDAVAMFMFNEQINKNVYDNLIKTVNDRMNSLHRYYELKKKVLGYDKLHLYDVYANLVDDNEFIYDFNKSKETVVSALSILGTDYIDILKNGLDNRWIDVYPNNGKRTGGYSSGSYDTYPYILLNYQDKYDDMSTLAHELGHSMHSYFARENNPYQYGNYTIFVAEVASTVNELLLAKYILKNSNDKKEKLFVLNRMMELFRATIYRQTMFSEFEKTLYDYIQNDKPITADILCNKYFDLNKKYFGDSVYLDDEIKYEWERIPHFYYNFYVYKYATGLSSASYIVNGLLDGSIGVDDYLSFLKCGSSKNPLDSLKLAKVDLSDCKVVNGAIDMFDNILTEFEKIYFV